MTLQKHHINQCHHFHPPHSFYFYLFFVHMALNLPICSSHTPGGEGVSPDPLFLIPHTESDSKLCGL